MTGRGRSEGETASSSNFAPRSNVADALRRQPGCTTAGYTTGSWWANTTGQGNKTGLSGVSSEREAREFMGDIKVPEFDLLERPLTGGPSLDLSELRECGFD